MSQDAVIDVIQKAVDDAGFRKSLTSKPDEVLVGYDLTEEERSGLSSLSAEAFDSFVASLDERTSRVGLLAHASEHFGVTSVKGMPKMDFLP